MDDLTHKTFGRLHVLERVKKDGKSVWKCECTCKDKDRNIVYVTAGHLKSGNTKSCGCLAIEARRQNGSRRKADLTNQRFGRLVALRIMPDVKTKSPTWECRCDCKKICYVTAQHLKSGDVKSCGCLLEESLKKQGRVTWEKVLKKKYINGTIIDFLFNPGKIRRDNTQGYPGIEERKRDGKWVAKLEFCNQRYWLGSYFSKAEAILARMQTEDDVIEEFMGHLKLNDPDKYIEFQSIIEVNEDKKREEIRKAALGEIKKNDLSKRKFEKLTVINDIGEYRGRDKIWKCKCKCGNIVYCTTSELRNGQYVSCNENSMECIKDDDIKNQNVTWDKSKNKWSVSIYLQHKSYFLCRTENEEYAQYIAEVARRHKKKGDFLEWYAKFRAV